MFATRARTQDPEPCGTLSLIGSEVALTNDVDKKRQTIRITVNVGANKRGSYKFVAPSDAETVEWVTALKEGAGLAEAADGSAEQIAMAAVASMGTVGCASPA